MIAQLITDIEALGGSLRRGNAVNVNDQSSKDRAIALATHYFSDVRPRVIAAGGETENVLQHDELWQQLVRLAHGNNARRTYVKIIGNLRKQLSEFNIAALASPVVQASQSSSSAPPFTRRDANSANT